MAEKERPFDYERAAEALAQLFGDSENLFRDGKEAPVPKVFAQNVDALFASKTQSYREVALGCGLVRLLDKSLNLRLPYVNQGKGAFNGRTLDEDVVNPFLHDRQVPASKGPYLATFRRSVKFDDATREGTRDKIGYDALIKVLEGFEATKKDLEIENLLRFILGRFVALRDASKVPIAKINKLTLDQYETLFDPLLQTKSGGLIPVLLTVAMFQTIAECFKLDWKIEWQGINVADKAKGAGGDISVITPKEGLICAIEVTERPIDRARVVSTFNTKISPNGIGDYMFVFSGGRPAADARQVANQYAGQGHDVNFVEIKPWLLNNLATIGTKCRAAFTRNFLALLDTKEVPAAIKVKWNDLVKRLFG